MPPLCCTLRSDVKGVACQRRGPYKESTVSYEYRLVFDHTSAAKRVMDVLAEDASCVGRQGPDLWLKDPALHNGADYDVGLTYEGDCSLWLQIQTGSLYLHARLQDALDGASVVCLEDGDISDAVTLRAAFRIR